MPWSNCMHIFDIRRDFSGMSFEFNHNVYYETEYRREWCSSKGKPSRCFLFARKFTRPAALRLLNTTALELNRSND
ncbi:hypothetical protein ACFX1X_045365 [Malus domestica]